MPDSSLTLPVAPPIVASDGWSLFLDFDGTLVPIAERHDGVAVDERLPGLIRALTDAFDGRLALVSGRPAAEILAYLGGNAAASPFAIAGSHGLELMWTDGRREEPLRPDGLDVAIATFRAFAADRPGVVVEEKPFGVALHYRMAPDAAEACEALAEAVSARTGIALQRGKMVAELRAAGADKGDAVRRFMGEAPMIGTRPLFVGDDLTDEAGFAAAEAMGGWGVLVGRARATAARYRLAGVDEVHAWLGDMVETARI